MTLDLSPWNYRHLSTVRCYRRKQLWTRTMTMGLSRHSQNRSRQATVFSWRKRIDFKLGYNSSNLTAECNISFERKRHLKHILLSSDDEDVDAKLIKIQLKFLFIDWEKFCLSINELSQNYTISIAIHSKHALSRGNQTQSVFPPIILQVIIYHQFSRTIPVRWKRCCYNPIVFSSNRYSCFANTTTTRHQ